MSLQDVVLMLNICNEKDVILIIEFISIENQVVLPKNCEKVSLLAKRFDKRFPLNNSRSFLPFPFLIDLFSREINETIEVRSQKCHTLLICLFMTLVTLSFLVLMVCKIIIRIFKNINRPLINVLI